MHTADLGKHQTCTQ